LRRHVSTLEAALPGSALRFMQSSGGVTDAARFRGPNALLSGPAGGVVGAARVASNAGFERAIGFDMGGTSTDVSLIRGGECERSFETTVGGVRVKAPMLRIHTIAAGGGSLCRFDGFRLTVGPESAGADPGPLCYGRRRTREGSPEAGLALTDVNLFLGRLQPDRFSFPVEREPVESALQALRARLRSAGHDLELDDVAAGFVEIANASMAEAIAKVSVERGVDPRDHALVGFGGAAGQHVCAVARELGIRTVLLHPLAGLLSAYGIGLSESTWDGQRDAGRVTLPAAGEPLPPAVLGALADLEADGRAALRAEGIAPNAIRTERWLDLRYRGSETPLAIREPADADFPRAFTAEHQARFGYTRPDRPIEIMTSRLRARGPGREPPRLDPSGFQSRPSRDATVWFPGVGRVAAPIRDRESLRPGERLRGPLVLLEDTGTVVIDPGFVARVADDGLLAIEDTEGPHRAHDVDLERFDPIRLEVFGNRFMSIAEQMGAVLRNTAVSTNIKERLDYSCAVFDAEGGLVANAPHIPVHLGAMGETVRVVREQFPDLVDGDVVVTNDPFAGGSHLPDITVVTPVFPSAGEGASGEAEAEPEFFVASRGHHADLGGITPGSMPADSRSLEEEGVLLRAFRLVQGGRFDEARARALLLDARYPARNADDNLADLEAMVAANRSGVRLLRETVREYGRAAVQTTMHQLQAAAAQKVAREIGRLPDGEHHFEDRLDDGTPIRVRLTVRGERMTIDFEGTGPASAGNLNAPRAVVQAAVIYVLRSLVAERIPLNGGCLEPVEIVVPAGSLLDPPEGSAVVGGNVETSQRIVDVLLGAIGRVAASQGTMNNVAFGDERFGYYETIGGGAGAGDGFAGASGVHTHMTNTRITDPEVLEARYPVRLLEFSLRRGSGGAGRTRGGDGLVRRYEFLAPVTVSLLTERRAVAPYGLCGGRPGAPGRNTAVRAQGGTEALPGKATLRLAAGDRLEIATPGGGGYGKPGGLAG
jgi:5-oxoprolinase (ATP-hydrolysing)